jgi:hypothetical protein
MFSCNLLLRGKSSFHEIFQGAAASFTAELLLLKGLSGFACICTLPFPSFPPLRELINFSPAKLSIQQHSAVVISDDQLKAVKNIIYYIF